MLFAFLPVAALGQQQSARNQAIPPTGGRVNIGGYHLHIDTSGTGEPAVVLIAGAGDFSFDWSRVQPAVSRFTRVCSYDRAGLAWSDLGPTPRTMRQEAHELHTLLKNAGIKAPYVLVGHSVGGLIARVYAEQYAQQVVGMVLVDSTHEDTTLLYQGKLVRVRDGAKGRTIPPVQSMKSSPPKPPTPEDVKQAQFNAQVFGPPKIKPPFDKLPPDIQKLHLWALSHPKLSAATDDFWPEELQAMHLARAKTKYPLGDLPLVVLMAGKSESTPPGVSAAEWKRLGGQKRQQKAGVVGLSRNSKLVVAARSGHHIQLDEPELVVSAIRQVVDAARRHTRFSTALPGRAEAKR